MVTLPVVERPLYRAATVRRVTGISYRMLDYYARQGIVEGSIPARGSGTRRLYIEDDIVAVAAVRAARAVGLDLDVCASLADFALVGVASFRHEHGPVIVTVDLAAIRQQVRDKLESEAAR